MNRLLVFRRFLKQLEVMLRMCRILRLLSDEFPFLSEHSFELLDAMYRTTILIIIARRRDIEALVLHLTDPDDLLVAQECLDPAVDIAVRYIDLYRVLHARYRPGHNQRRYNQGQ